MESESLDVRCVLAVRSRASDITSLCLSFLKLYNQIMNLIRLVGYF